jgi:hypothetical protein
MFSRYLSASPAYLSQPKTTMISTTTVYYARFDSAMTTKDGEYIQIDYGQAFRHATTRRVCYKTRLTEDDGSAAFGDRGFLVDLELLGGPHDGAIGEASDEGGLGGCIGIATGKPCGNPPCYDCYPQNGTTA